MIERMRPGDGERWRSIRLRALRDSPDAFGTTLDEAQTRPAEVWEHDLHQFATFVAVVGDSDVGVARGDIARGGRHDRASDTGYLLSMWVAPEARHRGIAALLIEAVVNWARTEGLHRLVLDVGEKNAPAIALYTKMGFAPNGVRGALPPPREHVREIQLELRL